MNTNDRMMADDCCQDTRKSLVWATRLPARRMRAWFGIVVFHLCLIPLGNLSADEIVPNAYYELSNKAVSNRHYSFLIQGSWGKSDAAHSWLDNTADPDYNRKAAQWRFIKATGGGTNDYWIVNRATGKYLAQTRTDKEDVDVADKGTNGSVWTVQLFKDGTHYKIINKASTYGLFQKSDGYEWDVHVWWKGDLNRDAFLWHADLVVDDPPAEPIKPGSFYRLSNKELSKRHDSFLIQGSYGVNDNAAHSWWEYAGDRGYRPSAYEWQFVPATGGGKSDYWIVNRATGKYLAQTRTNAWDVDVADKGANGSVWTVVLNEDRTHYKIINKASTYGLFQKDWGYEWDVHVWKDNPNHDAYLWKIQSASTIPTVTILSVKCIHPSTGIDTATKVMFGAVDIAVQIGLGAATGGGSVVASSSAQVAKQAAFKKALAQGAFKQAAKTGGEIVVMAGKSGVQTAATAANNLLSKQGMKEFAKQQVSQKALAERAVKNAALLAGNKATGQSADSFSELAFTTLYGESPDDLVVYVNGIKRWPDTDSSEIKSQQVIKLGLTIPYDPRQGFVIELKDYDSGSKDDGIGWMYWSPEAIRVLPKGYAKVLFENRSEGSLYVVEILVGTGFDGHK